MRSQANVRNEKVLLHLLPNQRYDAHPMTDGAMSPLRRGMIEDISRRKLFQLNFNKLDWIVSYVFDAALFDSRRHEIVIA